MLDKKYKDLEACVQDTMSLAAEYAKDGVEKNIGGPFGAAIIQKIGEEYKIIVIARNTVLMEKDCTCHAEINAIKKACRILERYNLEDCILVSTAKSCPMCISAACWARIQTVKYVLDYEFTEKFGFIDKQICNYIKGKNSIINEVKIKNDNAKGPFYSWGKKEDKNEY